MILPRDIGTCYLKQRNELLYNLASLADIFSGRMYLERRKAMERSTAGIIDTPTIFERLKKAGLSEEVAREIAHLCDPDNRHMTGMTLVMDGGLSLFGSAIMRD